MCNQIVYTLSNEQRQFLKLVCVLQKNKLYYNGVEIVNTHRRVLIDFALRNKTYGVWEKKEFMEMRKEYQKWLGTASHKRIVKLWLNE